MTETSLDRLLGGRVQLEQPRRGLRAAVDAVLLAAAIPARAGDPVLDLGCGAGQVFLCLAARVGALSVQAVELDPELAELARRNAARAGLAARIEQADLSRVRLDPVRHAFANPPYWPAGTASPDPARRLAAHEGAVGLTDWAAALSRALAPGGTASLILPASRFSAGAAALRAAGCGALALLPIWPRAGEPARRVILQGIRGGRGPDRLLPGLVLHGADGRFTPEAEAVLRHAAPLPMR
ncbi:MAG: methyltransferase domain-containing protein [Rhodovarius sp.]|nr:methyltransferase domain-containing protein [Rhodovarius sp.]